MPNVFTRRLNFQTLHVRLQHFDLNVRQPEHRTVIVDPQWSLAIRPTVVTSHPAKEISPNRTHLPANAGLFA